jgi:dTDP-4-amino-4,6-dideoxygalactose transaminase
MESKIWLSPPHMGGGEKKYIEEAFATNWIAPLGPNVTGFEQDLKDFLNDDVEVACLSSGTASIHLALILSGVNAGDEVICQSFTFSASANPILYLGATPIFIDSEEDTWNMCPNTLEEAIKDRIAKGKKPKAIVVVHLYGMPAKIEEISNIAKRYNVMLIEDAAEALGSSFNGKSCGTFGDFGILSFNGNKIISTSGGGALISKNEDTKRKAIFLATQARDEAPHYQHSHVGYNYRMSNIIAGIGRGQMEVLLERVKARRENNIFYQEIFKNATGIKVLTEQNTHQYSNHWLSSVIIDSKKSQFTREDLRLAFLNENIESRPLWKPMHLQPVFYEFPYYGADVSEKLFGNGLCLPSGSSLTKADKSRIEVVIRKFL